MSWKISFDPAKRERTLHDRGLDFLVYSMRKANEREIAAYRQQFEEG